ncbi:hypothetical protein CLAFUW4_11529 [Fulvia fulva]|uniref:Uncharacterized protein n=1 Tax=Passalora fulva TaxID=5499 RepID=A0A9Q8URZ6_PASFU|nr:uncharacterized protein CLAFUR5_10573 [Fulvia fulva]KAK4620033.1 hypothetical protein CLAFUR4_11535 [Fulvia fulva]KAK4620864.1 hypothetical protein CLAFUR0_11543 [Fulvia fulva]UJO20258.1 hypothetical protein CLAFUR5_10573 [Fulvia fulva]WPV16914.1 hypothetical protein CLAFUW4_11529 [Fulvia fulva]WPV32138.1 hypothetical protein CLAFUW7_11534 [Fulvia fulva]
MVGSINYLSTLSRPDITYAVGLAARYMSNLSEDYMKAVKRIFWLGLYLRRKPHLLEFKETEDSSTFQLRGRIHGYYGGYEGSYLA